MIIANTENLSLYPKEQKRKAPSFLFYDNDTLIGSFDIYGNEIWNFMIAAPYRAMGYGTKMMSELLDKFGSKKPCMRLWVEDRNKYAMRLYEHAGFSITSSTLNSGRSIHVMLWRNPNYKRRF